MWCRGTAGPRGIHPETLHILLSNVSEEGTLYGSIGTREITDSIVEKGIDLEKSSIRLPEGTLKEIGEYSIDIELHPEVVQGIKVVIAAKEEI